MFYLLLYVTEIVKQSHAVRGGRFRIEFQPGQGNLNHMYGNQVTHTTFLLSFQSMDPADTPSPTTESDHSVPVCPDKNKTYFYQEGARSFHSLVQSGTYVYRLPYFSVCG